MIHKMTLVFMLCILGAFSGQAEEKADNAWKIEAEKQIHLLGSEDFKARKQASEALLNLGWKVITLLKVKQKASKDLEVQTRINYLLSIIPSIHPIKNADAIVRGFVVFNGKKPKVRTLQTDSDPMCAAMHKHAPIKSETFLVDAKGGVKNVLVSVSKGLEAYTFPVPKTPFLLDQVGCRYEPHVFGIQVGQALQIRNSDNTLHNVHGMAKINDEFNLSQARKGQKTEKVFEDAETFIIRCDIHPWMSARCAIFETPYFTITKQDGSFQLPDLPSGQYTLTIWHEKLASQEIQIDLSSKKLEKLKITLKKR